MNFDRVARSYRVLETVAFGDALQRARVQWLTKVPRCKQALIVGEGNGRFLVELLRTQPDLQVECIDASRRMLDLARRRVEREIPEASPRVQFRHEDVRTGQIDVTGCDLIVTNFVLDCFDEEALGQVIPKLATAAAPDANWLFADFCLPSERLQRLKAKLWVKTMYLFFRVVAGLRTQELIDPTPVIHRHGFLLRDEAVAHSGMVTSQRWVRGHAG